MKLPEELLQKVGASHEWQAHADRYTPTVAQRPVLSCTARSKGMSDIAHNKESVRYRSVTSPLRVRYKAVTRPLPVRCPSVISASSRQLRPLPVRYECLKQLAEETPRMMAVTT